MRVYDVVPAQEEGAGFTCELLQQHLGHSDAVRAILHVPEKCQYITASWDHTLRVWRAAGVDKWSSARYRSATAMAFQNAGAHAHHASDEEEARAHTRPGPPLAT